MESDHHDPHHRNELYAALAGFRDWWRANRDTINRWLTGIMIVLLVVAGYRLWSYRSDVRHEQAWSDLAAATSPESLAGVARDHELPTVRALAHLRAGDLLLEKWVAPLTAGSPRRGQRENRPDPERPENGMERARSHFRRAAAVEQAPATVRLNARLGLATAAENEGKFDSAEKTYRRVIELARGAHPALATRAEARLERLEALRVPVTFARTQPSATRPAATRPASTQPATRP